jgi:phage terminase large subunit
MKLSDKQQMVADDKSRFRVLVSGRRFGKTHLALHQLAYHARIPNQLCFYVSPSYRMSKQIAWVQIKNILTDLRWIRKINEAELTLYLKNNSRICLRGADNPQSLRGIGLNLLIMDECADIDQAAWTEVLRPTLSDTGGKALFFGTPKGMNWFYDLYQQGQDTTNDSWSSYQFTTLDGGWVSEEEIEWARRDLDAPTFRQEYEATWEVYSGRVWTGFSMTDSVKHIEVPDDINTYHIGIDFNLDPMTATISYIMDGKMYVFDEIQIWSSNTDELVEEIHNRYKGKKIVAYPDPAARQRRTSAARRTDASILQNAGFVLKMPSRHMSIRDRVNSANSKMCNANNERGVFISPKCRNLINSLAKHTYKEGTSVPTKNEGWDHLTDALSYKISYLYPITKNFEPQPQQRFNLRTGNEYGRY